MGWENDLDPDAVDFLTGLLVRLDSLGDDAEQQRRLLAGTKLLTLGNTAVPAGGDGPPEGMDSAIATDLGWITPGK